MLDTILHTMTMIMIITGASVWIGATMLVAIFFMMEDYKGDIDGK